MNPGSDVRLREELERLKRLSGMGLNINLVWAPDLGGALSVEVKSSTIYVYEENEEEARAILRQEFLRAAAQKRGLERIGDFFYQGYAQLR
jgi:hypothetical protein